LYRPILPYSNTQIISSRQNFKKIKEEIENVTKIGNMVVWRVTMQMLTHNDQELLNEYSIETTLSDFSTLYLSKKNTKRQTQVPIFNARIYSKKSRN